MVTIVEGVTRATVNGTEGSDDSRGGVFMETSILATIEVRLVIIESGSTTSIGDIELITSFKLEVAGLKCGRNENWLAGGLKLKPILKKGQGIPSPIWQS